MTTSKRTRWVYGVLLAVWALIMIWQGLEHRRVQADARVAVYPFDQLHVRLRVVARQVDPARGGRIGDELGEGAARVVQ